MRLHGFCTSCHKIKRISVRSSELARMAAQGSTVPHPGFVTVEFDSEFDLAEAMLVDELGGVGVFVGEFKIEDEQPLRHHVDERERQARGLHGAGKRRCARCRNGEAMSEKPRQCFFALDEVEVANIVASSMR